MSDIVLYTSKDGHVELNVNLYDETVWLTQKQLADLFDKNIRTISEHINNIFKDDELQSASVVRNFRITAADGKTYDTKHYNLDVIISVGYRVKSKQGVAFRQWATQVLKQHLIKGYTTHKARLAEQGLHELQQTVELLQSTLMKNELVNDIGHESIQLIICYAKTWNILLAYDEDRLELLKTDITQETQHLDYQKMLEAITALKDDLMSKKEASEIFGIERNSGFQSILQTIEQTFDGSSLYPTLEIKAAHLFYFMIKDHPFVDGNKRIGCFIFLLYLNVQNKSHKLNENGLIALALLVAESKPNQKDLIIRLIVNLLVD